MKIEELNLSALKYFIDAVESESITISSEKNFVSRPAVSQAIIRLEHWYGKKLLKHEKRSFTLTEDGRQFYRLAKKNYQQLREGFINPLDNDKSLRIGCSASLIERVFPKSKKFIEQSENPCIRVGSTDLLLNLLEKREINVAFLIESQKISKFNVKTFHSGFFDLRSRNSKWSEVLITTESRPEVDSLLQFISKKQIPVSKHISVESWTAASRIAEMINGVALVPEYFPKNQLQSVKISSWNFPYRAILVYQKEFLLSKLEQNLIEIFEDNQ
ncbi:MAG: LysR family transcriptional regulator [Bdellovibrionaceae bacterium]|nr:LysR family transcriptional regulator [Pseudobdellovibrionaceae bacterium]NUM57939.1 LysR family transcriptional regulator [Pseudobdellovibrionaceae bacterium]